MKRIMMVAIISLNLCSYTTAMELDSDSVRGVSKKLSSLSLQRKNSQYQSVDDSSVQEPSASKEKAFVYFRKKNSLYQKESYATIKEFAAKIIANPTIPAKSRAALSCHFLFHNLGTGGVTEKNYSPFALSLFDALKNNSFDNVSLIKVTQKYDYASLIPHIITYDPPTLLAIRKIIDKIKYNDDADLRDLKKICDQACIPQNDLWNYAFLYAANYVPETSYPKSLERQTNLVTKILSYGPSINKQDIDEGNTALICAARNGNDQLVHFLCEHKAKITIKNDKNYSALMQAIFAQNSTTLIPLLAHQDIINREAHDDIINHQADDEETALSLAVKKGDPDAVVLLLNNNAQPTMKAFTNCLDNSCGCELMKILLQSGANVNLKDKNNATILMHLAKNIRYISIIKYILTYCDVMTDLKDDHGRTALHHALMTSNNEIATLLLLHGANPNVQDKTGESAFHYLCRLYSNSSRFHESVQLTHYFLYSHADINLANNQGVTPYNIIENGKNKILLYFIKTYELGVHHGKKLKKKSNKK